MTPACFVRLLRRLAAAVGFWPVLLGLVACDGGEEPVSRGSACDEVSRASCTRSVQCNLTFTNIQLCTERTVQACCEARDTCDQRVDGAVWDECAADIEVQGCADFQSGPPPSCAAVLDGTF